MSAIGRLAAGSVVRLRGHGRDLVVGECLGAGGQGEVYRVWAPHGPAADAMALKWYFAEWSTPQQWADLTWLTAQPPPGPAFLWPVDVALATTADQASSFGYVMPLRPERFQGCVEIVSGRLSISFGSLLRACMHLAGAFGSLHARGLCYRDISFGNAFVDPASGEVLICDNDNVAVNLRGTEGIHGTDRFMAPEIVRGEALPSAATDLYSLAVLLFYLLMIAHPLEGVRMYADGDVFTAEEAARLYGWEPLFVFDPDDPGNAPDPVLHKSAWLYWTLYPRLLRDLFVRAFTDGLRDPDGRVREGEWRDAMARLLDLLVDCHHCGAQVFVEPGGRPVAGVCWSCATPPLAGGRVPMLAVEVAGERYDVALPVGRLLYGHHLRGQRYDYGEVGAQVVRHPTSDTITGLRNLTAGTWTVTRPGAATTLVAPGRSVAIVPEARIEFGHAHGTVDGG